MLEVKTFVFNPFQENTYVIYDESRECLIVDAGCNSTEEKQELIRFIRDVHLTPVALINTHCHIDHILGVEYLKVHFSLPFKIHEADKPLLAHAEQQAVIFDLDFGGSPEADGFLRDGDIVEAGTVGLKILHIPGHSPGSIAMYNETGRMVFVGDVLFRGSIGRTDLPGGDYDTLISGIREKLLGLPPETIVYSGHGPPTTIEQEMYNNPFLK